MVVVYLKDIIDIEVTMDVINDLVDETVETAEDKAAYEKLKAVGLDPFHPPKKLSDVIESPDVSTLVLKEVISEVDSYDCSLSNLIYLHTDEGLKDLQRRSKAQDAFDSGEGVFSRGEELPLCEFHDITEDEAVAIDNFLSEYERKFNKKLDENQFVQLLMKKQEKAREALCKDDSHFRRSAEI
jgi:hypothetical protein